MQRLFGFLPYYGYLFIVVLSSCLADDQTIQIVSPKRVKNIEEELDTVKNQLNQIDHDQPAENGITYIRWGKNSCPHDTETVYTGQAGGNNYKNPGGGVNYLCLPSDPQFDAASSGVAGNHQIFGAEYEEHYIGPTKGSHNLIQHDVPCAVCLRRGKYASLMIPARKECYGDWQAEYTGYLMSSHINHKKKEFVCVDIDAEEYTHSSTHNHDGALFYSLQTQCGSLNCGPGKYKNEKQVLCVVCSK